MVFIDLELALNLFLFVLFMDELMQYPRSGVMVSIICE